MLELSVVIILVACVIVFILNNRNSSEKILAGIYALSGLALMLLPITGWSYFLGFVIFCVLVFGTMNDGSLNPTKLPSKAIGIMMVCIVPIKLVFIDWIGWEGAAGWLIFPISLYWCYEYIMACRKN